MAALTAERLNGKDLSTHHIPQTLGPSTITIHSMPQKSPPVASEGGSGFVTTPLLPMAYQDLPDAEKRLVDMLTYKRPHGSKSERKFINRFIRPLGVREDGFGNLIKVVGNSPVLWSCHTDTVHKSAGRQSVHLSGDGWLSAPHSDCLGADCAAGVWIMSEMIRLGIGGTYVFHRDEESGGHGATWITNNTPELLKPIKYAIAFDRKGFGSVITHQFGSRGCSEAFANALSHELGEGWAPDDGGTFTDTAMYFEHVPECTNISVGYVDQHTRYEKLYLPFLVDLLGSIAALDVDSLPCERDHTADDELTGGYYYRGGYGRSYGSSGYDDYSVATGGWGTWDDYEPRPSNRSAYDRLLEAIADHPDAVAEILDAYGIGADEILMAAYGKR